MRVLLVDNNSSERQKVCGFLDKLPFTKYDNTHKLEVIQKKSAEEAIEQIEKDHDQMVIFDLLITAQKMDQMTGVELANKLLEKDIAPNLPVVIYCENITDIKNKKHGSELTLFFELPFSNHKFKSFLEKITESMVKSEDDSRKKAIQKLMEKNDTKDFLAPLEDVYMNSARSILKCKMYAPWSQTPYLSLGQIYIGCNMQEKAIPHLKTAISINFKIKEAHRDLAMCYKATGRSFEELAELKQMLKANPDSSTVLMKVGDAYLREGDYKSAVNYLKESIAKHTSSDSAYLKAKSHVGLGRAYIKAGDVEKDTSKYVLAKDEFDKAVSIDPTLIAAYNNLIIVYQKMDMYEEARATMAKAVEIMPNSAEGWLDLFDIYLIDGETQKAKFALQKALMHDPENQIIITTAGEIYIRQKMFREAIEMFSRAIEINPSDTRFYNYMGICCRRLEQFRLASDCYAEALKINPDDPNLHYNLGKSYYQDNMLSAARASYEAALKINPDFKEAKKGLDEIKKHSDPQKFEKRRNIR